MRRHPNAGNGVHARLNIYDIINIHNIMEIRRHSPSSGERHFIDEMAALLEPWGMTRSVGRVYGYLLLSPEPVDLEKIAADLEMSKGGAWNAARLLEGFGHVRRYGAPGSKRALYGQSGNLAAPLQEQVSLLGSMAKLLQTSATTIADDDVAARLKKRADFYLSMKKVIEDAIEEFSAIRPGARKKTAKG